METASKGLEAIYVISITHVPGAKVEGWYEYCETSLPVYKPAQSY